jgi:hypothetical protein
VAAWQSSVLASLMHVVDAPDTREPRGIVAPIMEGWFRLIAFSALEGRTSQQHAWHMHDILAVGSGFSTTS